MADIRLTEPNPWRIKFDYVCFEDLTVKTDGRISSGELAIFSPLGHEMANLVTKNHSIKQVNKASTLSHSPSNSMDHPVFK